MAVHKRKRNGKVSWYYKFDAPGSTREGRRIIREFGFATKGEAQDAESVRRVDEQKKFDIRKSGAPRVAAALPKTLAMLMDEFFRQHVEEKLAPKTIERYRQQAAYLDPELLQMPLTEITPLHLSREWTRLLKSGGHTRKTKEPKSLSTKTVRNTAGVISSAFTRAVKWGLVERNPVKDSEPPVPKKHRGIALTPAQQALVFEAATGPWCIGMFLEMCAATGARRGEILALRWSDIQDGRAVISRSLTQTKHLLAFKDPKTEDSVRSVSLPASVLGALEQHRQQQGAFRLQFGRNYRADLDLIFANPDGTPLRPNSVSATVSNLCKKLKLPKGVSLHTLRHSHGSHLLAAGMEITTVSERLGHSSVRVTADIYSHAIRGRDDEAARRWEEFQQQATQDRPETRWRA